jgi:hypothetical protein
MKNKILALLINIACVSLMHAAPRVWTSLDGRKLNAEFISASDSAVQVRRDDGMTLTIPFASLSADDIIWVKNQPKPIVITQEQLNKLLVEFPAAPALSNGEVTNDLKQLHDKYESDVKFFRPKTFGTSLKTIRAKIDADIKVLSEIAKTTAGDSTGRRGSSQSAGAENGILSARRSLSWLQGSLLPYLRQYDTLLETGK